MESSVIRGYTVCEHHFSPLCVIESGKLRRDALPTRNLPNTHNEPADCFMQLPTASLQHVERDLLSASVKNLIETEAVEPSSQEENESPPWKVTIPEKTYLRQTGTPLYVDDIHQPSTSSAILPQARPAQEPSIKHPHIRRKKLSSDARILYDKLRFLRRQEHQAKLRNLSLKQKVKVLARKPHLIDCLHSLNDATSNFIMSQQRNQKLRPKGRRFTTEDKILALSILKQSGRCYRYLSQIFSLPSRRTLTTLLSKVRFNPGINTHIFAQLKKTVTKMSGRSKYCVLMFDEISLQPGLQYNQKNDCIEGLVDFGGSERSVGFADHALVFMLKGIYKKWKQPICYTFCENATPKAHLVKLIKDIVRGVKQVGLHIVATICDQGTTNVAAINILLNDTRAYCLRNN
ncbi:unnamed protein product, partial [Callosobruchus maculatus]